MYFIFINQQDLTNLGDEKIELLKEIEEYKEKNHLLEEDIYKINTANKEEVLKWSNSLEAMEVYLYYLEFIKRKRKYYFTTSN